MDTCKSGNVTGSNRTRAIADPTSAQLEQVSTESGVLVMSALTGFELSVEDSAWGHGAFTKGLLDGLKGPADFNKDNVISLTELNLSITYTVKELTRGKQHPTAQIPANMPDFPLFIR